LVSAQGNEMKNLQSRITIKSLKTGFGHDRSGCMCNVYLDNKKIIQFHDDGYGGESDIDYVKPEHEKILNDHIEKFDSASINSWLKDLGCKWADSSDRRFVIEMLITGAMQLAEKERILKKIERLCVSKIVCGDQSSYTDYGWKAIKSLSELVEHKDGLELLQSRYNLVKTSLKEGHVIFNKDADLLALGIVL
jgi:hypothetical protein